MEISPESSENENESYSTHTYCRTEVISKTLTSVWNLHDFWTIYESVNTLRLNADGENLPFDIALQVDRGNDKFAFYVKNSSKVKHCIYNISLQSVASNNFYVIPPYYDGEVYCYEVKRSFLMEQLRGFVSRNTLRVIVKVCYIENIFHNTMSTTTLPDYTVNNYKATLKDLCLYDTSAFVTFKVNDKQILIHLEALCARSNFFKELFNEGLQENTTIHVDNVPLDVVVHFKTFVQQGNTYFLKYADLHKLFSLFIMAKTYQVVDLQTICEQYLKELLLQKENIFHSVTSLDVLIFAYENSVMGLLDFAVKFIAININDHINTKRFSETIHRYPPLLTLLKQAETNTSKAYYSYG